jgi:hypothetical protein
VNEEAGARFEGSNHQKLIILIKVVDKLHNIDYCRSVVNK